MTSTTLTLLGLIPAGVIILGGLLILYTGGETAGHRRLLQYLLFVGFVLLFVKWLAARSPSQFPGRSDFVISYLLAPSIWGVVVLILVNIRAYNELRGFQKLSAILLGAGICILSAFQWNGLYGIYSEYLVMAVLLAVLWGLRRHLHKLDLLIGFLLAVWLLAYDQSMFFESIQRAILAGTPGIRIFGLFNFWLPVIAVGLAAILVFNGIRRLPNLLETQLGSAPLRLTSLRLGLAIFLMGAMAYRIFWETIWDQTSDGLGGVYYGEVTAALGIAAGMLLTLALRERKRIAGWLFIVTVPTLAIAAFSLGIAASYHSITQGRAARIQHALEKYASRTGHYPEQLSELVPRDLLQIPGPVILRTETWCYQGGQDFYRLGAIYREFFSAPISIHVYASTGSPPGPEWECQEQYSVLKDLYNSSMEETFIIPTPTPQPDSTIPGG